MPNSKVIKALFGTYLTIRYEQKKLDASKTKICDKYIQQADEAKTSEQWLQLARDLTKEMADEYSREGGYIAWAIPNLLWKRNYLLHKTLHAVLAYVVADFEKNQLWGDKAKELVLPKDFNNKAHLSYFDEVVILDEEAKRLSEKSFADFELHAENNSRSNEIFEKLKNASDGKVAPVESKAGVVATTGQLAATVASSLSLSVENSAVATPLAPKLTQEEKPADVVVSVNSTDKTPVASTDAAASVEKNDLASSAATVVADDAVATEVADAAVAKNVSTLSVMTEVADVAAATHVATPLATLSPAKLQRAKPQLDTDLADAKTQDVTVPTAESKVESKSEIMTETTTPTAESLKSEVSESENTTVVQDFKAEASDKPELDKAATSVASDDMEIEEMDPGSPASPAVNRSYQLAQAMKLVKNEMSSVREKKTTESKVEMDAPDVESKPIEPEKAKSFFSSPFRNKRPWNISIVPPTSSWDKPLSDAFPPLSKNYFAPLAGKPKLMTPLPKPGHKKLAAISSLRSHSTFQVHKPVLDDKPVQSQTNKLPQLGRNSRLRWP